MNLILCIKDGVTGNNCQTVYTYSTCTSNKCLNGATCYQTSYTEYGCACLGGFYGTYCENTLSSQTACLSNPCLNGGTCQGNGNTYTCTCDTNHVGINCEIGTLNFCPLFVTF